MEIKISEELESTVYRCLFEYIKQNGIESVFGLAQDIQSLPNREILVQQTILFDERNDLIKLAEKHKDVIDYLKKHSKELTKLSFFKEDVLNILQSLSKDISLLDTYLENAKKLEKLKVADISITSSLNNSLYNCDIFRDANGKIINIKKQYTDGKTSVRKEILENEEFNYSIIPFYLTDATFMLQAKNSERLYQHRGIQITNFSFDGNSLPTEEEIQSYEIPKRLIMN